MLKTSQEFAVSCLPPIEADANKYTRGLCELVVGSSRYPGAGVLACMAANRMGAGYIKAYTSEKTANALLTVLPSAVSASFGEFAQAKHEASEHHPLAIVVGCGMAGEDSESALVLQVLAQAKAPVVVDGGGLAALTSSQGLQILQARHQAGLSTIITPHGGEAYRLIKAVSPVGAEEYRHGDRAPSNAAAFLARAYGVTCVLKGSKTYVFHQDQCLEMDEGTAALAKAGTGDILAGIIGSLLAQGASPVQACVAGTFLHARAGRLATAQLGARCVAAEDVITFLPAALRSLGA